MATPVFQPPPTHTEVILKDAQSRWLFNPAWVKWFLELTQMINNSGGGSGTIQHNSTGGLQGGGTGEYYHLTNQEHGWVADTPAAPTTKFWRGDHTWTGTLAGPFQATNITGTGNLSIQGNTTLGDSITDTITFTGQMASTLLWGTDNTLDIGASGANRPRDLYLGRDLYVGGTLTITGGIVITGDLTVNGNTTLGNSTVDTLTIASSAITWSGTPTHSGNHTWSGNMTVNGNVTVKGNTAIGDATSDTFTIAPNNITWTNNPTHSGNHAWSGRQVINTTSNTHSILAVGGSATLLVGTTQNAIELNPIFSAAATNSEYAIVTQTTGASGVHNTATVAGINIQDHTTGTSQTVSSSYGILIDDRISTVSVRAAGIRSNLTSGSSKYNIYAIGTAMNVLAGNTRVGGGTDPTVALDVTGAALISTTLGVTGTLTASGNLTVNGNTTLGDSSTDTFTITSNVITWSNNPTHSGNHTWSGNMTINGNVVLGDSSTDTLTIATNTVTWSNNPTHSGNHTWSGSMTMNGNVVIGDSSTDTLTIAPNAVTWSNNPTHSGTHIITGRLGVGGSLSALTHFYVTGSGLASGIDQGGIYSDCTFTAGATNSEAAFSARTTGAAGSHTTVAAIGLAVADHVLGAAQTVTGSYGVLIQNRTAAATLIAGVASQISSGTGKWNWYSSGTADSSFNGNVRIGSNVAPTVALDVTGSIIASVNLTAWTAWTPTRTGWTDVGSPTVTARYCRIRNAVMFQIKVVPSTTVATVAGTSYTDLPVAAGSSGLAGIGVMGNDTTRISIGNGEFDIANSRFYVPTQGATANTLQLSGWYEV